MTDNKTPKYLVMIIMLVLFGITVGGYVLYYQSHKRIVQKDREYELIKEKQMHAEENYNDLQKKYEGTTEELKQMQKDYDDVLQKHQECKAKLEELQTKYDNLLDHSQKIENDLNDAKIKLGITTPNKPETEGAAPATSEKTDGTKGEKADGTKGEKTDGTKKGKKSSSSENEVTPSPTPTSATSQTPLAKNAFQCPSSALVTQNISTGSWDEGKVTWWVDFTSRPLNTGESVKDLFKMLYDGQALACYYELTRNSTNAWVVLKGNSKEHKALKAGNEGWAPCTNTDECKVSCSAQNLSRCQVMLSE